MDDKKKELGYRIKTARPVCGNCEHKGFEWPVSRPKFDCCLLAGFQVDIINGTCNRHEWKK